MKYTHAYEGGWLSFEVPRLFFFFLSFGNVCVLYYISYTNNQNYFSTSVPC